MIDEPNPPVERMDLGAFSVSLTVKDWDSDTRELESFTDVRELQRRLKDRGVTFISEADVDATGPASFMILDPDGNPILVDQHV